MTDEATMVEVVFPWHDEGFKGTPQEKLNVYANLRRVGIAPDRWAEKPDEMTVKAVKSLMDLVLEQRWVLVCSGSVELLQALAQLSAVVYSLTTQDSSLVVTTDEVIRGFFGSDEDRVVKADLRTAGLVVWGNVLEAPVNAGQFHSRFAEILVKRKQLRFPTVFLGTYILRGKDKFDERAMETVTEKLEQSLGTTSAALAGEMVEMVYLNVEPKAVPISNLKV